MAETKEKIFDVKTENNAATIKVFGVIGFPAWMQAPGEPLKEPLKEQVDTKEELRTESATLEGLSENISRINIEIDSPGGNLDHAMAMYRTLERHPAEKFVSYEGNSGSAATILGSVAPRENISIPSYLTLLIHEARANPRSSITQAKAKEIDRELETHNRNIAEIYASSNGLTVERNLEIMRANQGEGRVMSASELKGLGFVGNVIELNNNIEACDYTALRDWSVNQIAQLKEIEDKRISNYNINNASNQKSNMDLFGKNKKKNPFTLDVDGKRLIISAFEENGSVMIDGDDGEYSGTINHGDKTATVEGGKIVAIKKVSTADREITALKDDNIALKKENAELRKEIETGFGQVVAEITEVKKGFTDQISALTTEIGTYKTALDKARIKVSSPKLPKTEAKIEDAQEDPVSVNESIYEAQQRMHDEKEAKRAAKKLEV